MPHSSIQIITSSIIMPNQPSSTHHHILHPHTITSSIHTPSHPHPHIITSTIHTPSHPHLHTITFPVSKSCTITRLSLYNISYIKQYIQSCITMCSETYLHGHHPPVYTPVYEKPYEPPTGSGTQRWR